MAKKQIMGKSTGYHTDGESYWLAPMLKDAWTDLDAEARGLEILVQMVARHAGDRLTAVEQRRLKWWDRVCDDLSLDRTQPWVFHRLDGRISLKPDEDARGD